MAIYKKYSTVKASINTLLAPGTLITADRHRQVEQNLLDFAENQWLPGDIKKVVCTTQYIEQNFVATGPTAGLGIVGGNREGWAICNGNNLTKNRTGRVPIGYGTKVTIAQPAQYPTVGATGGSKDAVVVAHTHVYTKRYGKENGWAFGSDVECVGWNSEEGLTTSNVGESGTDKNMQPYMVILFIQKL